VQAVDFVSDDPSFAGTMTMTWEVTPIDGGSRVDVTADNVPDGISEDDHAAGLTSFLANLADYLEQQPLRQTSPQADASMDVISEGALRVKGVSP